MYNIDYHITDKCNLNCVSCGHFCPLVPPSVEHKSIDQVKYDLELLKSAESNGLQFSILTLTGGEVTLHPQLDDIVRLAGNLFKGKLRLWTNGLLYDRLIQIKDTLDEFDVQVYITNYNQKFSDKAIEALTSNLHAVNIDRSLECGGAIFNDKFFSKSRCTTLNQVTYCHSRNLCVQLVDGKLYPCQYLAHIHYLEDKFKDKLELEIPTLRCVDLSEVTDPYVINSFIDHYMSELCLHCMDYMKGRPTQLWRRSDKKLEEWYDER